MPQALEGESGNPKWQISKFPHVFVMIWGGYWGKGVPVKLFPREGGQFVGFGKPSIKVHTYLSSDGRLYINCCIKAERYLCIHVQKGKKLYLIDQILSDNKPVLGSTISLVGYHLPRPYVPLNGCILCCLDAQQGMPTTTGCARHAIFGHVCMECSVLCTSVLKPIIIKSVLN